jgi:NitT/TauT family transport system substrate-binding protein
MHFGARRFAALALALTMPLAFAACGDDNDSNAGATDDGTANSDGSGDTAEPVTVRLGYFPNVTHAPAVYGIQNGSFEDDLGGNITLETSIFNAGGEAVQALFADALDITFIGPGPSLSGYAESGGDVQIVSGVATGGAFLVTSPDITEPEQLEGKKIATPSVGNTQDVALRHYLKDELGLETTVEGGGDVSIIPQENALTLDAMKAGDIDGAWVPEPWATRLIEEAGAQVLIDERDLWPEGQFSTTVLLAKKDFVEEHPEAVKAVIEATANAIEAIEQDSDSAAQIVSAGIEAGSGKAIPVELVTASFESIDFGLDPVASSIVAGAEHAQGVELLDPIDDVSGLFALDIVNEVLEAKGEEAVSGA